MSTYLIYKEASNQRLMRSIMRALLLLVATALLTTCEKEINVVLPEATDKLVVEGRIETGTPAYVILTRSTGYFDPTDITTFENSFVHDAIVTISNGTETDTLAELCSQDLPPELLPLLASGTGINPEDLATINYCLYTIPIADLLTGNYFVGETGKSYALHIEANNEAYNASAHLPTSIPLDSTWWQPEGDPDLGFVWATLSDPDTMGNGYRWWARRINSNSAGNPKDANFVPPLGGAFDDRFINGKHFDFGYQRGRSAPGDLPEESGFFKRGDTVVVKFSSTDIEVFHYLRAFENEAGNAGNPFASPSPIKSNVIGEGDYEALGVWAGFSNFLDTVYAE